MRHLVKEGCKQRESQCKAQSISLLAYYRNDKKAGEPGQGEKVEEEAEGQIRLQHIKHLVFFETPDLTVKGVFGIDIIQLVHIHLLSFFVTFSSTETPILAISAAQCLTQLLAVMYQVINYGGAVKVCKSIRSMASLTMAFAW